MPGVEHSAGPLPSRVQSTHPSPQAAQALAAPNAWTEEAGRIATPVAPPSSSSAGGPNTMKQRSERQGVIARCLPQFPPEVNRRVR